MPGRMEPKSVFHFFVMFEDRRVRLRPRSKHVRAQVATRNKDHQEGDLSTQAGEKVGGCGKLLVARCSPVAVHVPWRFQFFSSERHVIQIFRSAEGRGGEGVVWNEPDSSGLSLHGCWPSLPEVFCRHQFQALPISTQFSRLPLFVV